MDMEVEPGMAAKAGNEAGARARVGLRVKHRYTVECFDRRGTLRWSEGFDNIVVNEGLDDYLDKYWKGSAYTAAHYVGLKGTGTIDAGDTMASHAGWSELTPYSDVTRPQVNMGTVSGQSVDNSGAKAVFNINASATVAGAFVSTDNTKGGTTGLLVGGGDFAAARSVESGDTLNVTITATAS